MSAEVRDPRIDPIVGDVVERSGVVRTVTQADRDALSKTLWELIEDRTRWWKDADDEVDAVLASMVRR